jgi:gas vesicle protein
VGYVRGVLHGALAGAIIGMLYAPERGTVTRRRLSRWLVEAEDVLGSGTSAVAPGPTRRRASAGRSDEPTKRA